MANVSGQVVFDRNRSAVVDAGDTGISNVPIALQNTGSNVGAIVLTDNNGNFQFTNVPDGSYRLVECWGTSGGAATPVDFGAVAGVITSPTPKEPPISQVLLTTTVPAGSTGLSALSPNTLFVAVAGADVNNQIYLDGPFRDIPFQFQNTNTIGSNLITTGGNGIFGTLPAGTSVDNFANPNPYPGIAPSFTYVPNSPLPGQYTFVNIFNNGFVGWWNTTDHTTGMEMSRIMAIDGANPGATFFLDTVSVSQNTNYLFSTWMMNLYAEGGHGLPRLGIEISALNGTVFYAAPLITIPVDLTVLTWREVGAVFNSGTNTQVIVKFIAQSNDPDGNDYSIDDVRLSTIEFNQLVTASKSVDKLITYVGDTIAYTIVVKNNFSTEALKVRILDTIPSGTDFINGSVYVDGVNYASANPGNSFTIPTLPGNTTTTVTYNIKCVTYPSPNPIPNSAAIDYNFYAAIDSITVPQYANTNTVNTLINYASLDCTKTASHPYISCGENLKYTIAMRNIGNVSVYNTIFKDTIPTGTSFVNNSFTLNGVTINGANPSSGVSIGTISANVTSTVTFTVTVNCQ